MPMVGGWVQHILDFIGGWQRPAIRLGDTESPFFQTVLAIHPQA